MSNLDIYYVVYIDGGYYNTFECLNCALNEWNDFQMVHTGHHTIKIVRHEVDTILMGVMDDDE